MSLALPATGAPLRVRIRAWRGLTLPARSVGLVLPLLLLALWQALIAMGAVSRALLPSPALVIRTLVILARGGELRANLEATGLRIAAGFAIGVAAGTLLGALTGAWPTARRALDPTVQALRAVPSIAWVPLFIIWLGIFEGSKIALIAVGVFFPVYLNLMSGIVAVDRRLIEVARICGLSRWGVAWHVMVPASGTAYVAGLRGGLGLGWMFVAAAELMGASDGLGYMLIDGEQTGRPELVVAAILLFALCGKLSDAAVAHAAVRSLRWQAPARL